MIPIVVHLGILLHRKLSDMSEGRNSDSSGSSRDTLSAPSVWKTSNHNVYVVIELCRFDTADIKNLDSRAYTMLLRSVRTVKRKIRHGEPIFQQIGPIVRDEGEK